MLPRRVHGATTPLEQAKGLHVSGDGTLALRELWAAPGNDHSLLKTAAPGPERPEFLPFLPECCVQSISVFPLLYLKHRLWAEKDAKATGDHEPSCMQRARARLAHPPNNQFLTLLVHTRSGSHL